MRTDIIVVGFLMMLVGFAVLAYSETSCNNRMKQILDWRDEFGYAVEWTEQKYMETGEWKYLQLYQDALDLYFRTFELERLNENTRSQGMYAGGLLIFAGIAGIVGGLLSKSKPSEEESTWAEQKYREWENTGNGNVGLYSARVSWVGGN